MFTGIDYVLYTQKKQEVFYTRREEFFLIMD